MRSSRGRTESVARRPAVAVVGAGAGGVLAAVHLVRTAARRGTGLDLLLVDPVDRWGRGTAFGTSDDEHLLNVTAGGMTALPEDPGHFVAWLARQDVGATSDPNAFVARRQYARYLDDTLTGELAAADHLVSLRHLRTTAEAITRAERGWAVVTHDCGPVVVDAVVVATGLPQAGTHWAGSGLLDSAFFVPDPWAPGSLDVVRRDRSGPADVLLVGSGLTMVDVVMSLSGPGNRPERRLHALSRSGRLPRRHAPEPGLAVIPDVGDWGHRLDDIVERAERHVRQVRASTGDWRPAVDGLRFRVAELWGRLDEEDRARFLAGHAGAWNVLRHRMPPTSAAVVDGLRAAGRLSLGAGTVVDARPLSAGGLAVALSDGTQRDVGWVVNCTGPRSDVRDLAHPLLDDLLRDRTGGALATIATAGMGFRTDQGRLVGAAGGSAAPIWVLGALRRGELWESTAVPEIRLQASAVAVAVLDTVAPLPRRLEDGRLVGGHHPVARPRDLLGLPLSTTAEAAAAFNAGLERLMRLQSGAEELVREATVLDPNFAVAHAALAMLGHEAGADTDVRAALRDARRAIAHRGDAREASLVDVVARRVEDVDDIGAQALANHLATHPRDVLAVSAAVPTIAFSGITDVRREAWDLVEGLAPAYGDHWWYISLLAFVRQDQGRFEEAGLLAESALSCEPASGHAVHAQAHVLYETGQHDVGRTWLDHWVAESGRSASHRAHFSWHAALHELAMGDVAAVGRRYEVQLAPPVVQGVRALVDSASLLWRWQLVAGGDAGPSARAIVATVGPGLVHEPQTPFVAAHAAIALAAASDVGALDRLRERCSAASDATMRSVVAPICEALASMVRADWAAAARVLAEVLPDLPRIGGSAAQREVFAVALDVCRGNLAEQQQPGPSVHIGDGHAAADA